jgi:hypothetical protein
MTGFEDYRGELREIDREIAHYAAVCGVDSGDSAAVHGCIAGHPGEAAGDPVRQRVRTTLQGLLVLRLLVETEMLRAGLQPPELAPGVALHALAGKVPDGGG